MSVWMFQAVKKQYDLRREVPRWRKIGELDAWRVTRYGDQMKSGDVVLLWQAGDDAGIYATGELVGELFQVKDCLRVKVRYNPLLRKPICREALLKHPVLSNLLIIRSWLTGG